MKDVASLVKKMHTTPKGAEDIDETQCYNDHEFYRALLTDFLNANNEQNDAQGGGEDEFLHGADLTLTQRAIAKRQKLQEAGLGRTKKEVDRKATKGRKIKYIVHEKIKSFMAPEENRNCVHGRDDIVKKLFGKKDAPQKSIKPAREITVRII